MPSPKSRPPCPPRLVFALLALLAMACVGDGGDRSPTAPSAPARPPPATVTAPYPWWPNGTQTWGNTTRIVEVEGPDACYVRDARLRLGQSVGPSPMGVRRDEDVIEIHWDDGLSTWVYLGTVEGERFSAVSSLGGWRWGCTSGVWESLLRIEFQLTGRFSADGRQLVATHVATHHFRTGVMTVVEEWAATLEE